MSDDEFDFDAQTGGALTEGESRVAALKPCEDRDFAELDVPQAFRNLFLFIEEYEPRQRRLAVAPKAFLPEYVPAFGDVDDFVKLPRPDDIPEHLGKEVAIVLDEPCLDASEASILRLKIGGYFEQGSLLEGTVQSVDPAQPQGRSKLDDWIQNVAALHEREARRGVVYRHPMPSLDVLMQQWPPELADAFTAMDFAVGKDTDCDLETFVALFCSVLGIPVFPEGALDALHVLFSLLIEFQENPYI